MLQKVSFLPVSLELSFITPSIPTWGRGSFVSQNEGSVAHAAFSAYWEGCWKRPAKHPAKGRKALPFLSSPRFQKAQKMNCKKCCPKKIFDSHSIKTGEIKSIFFNIARSLSLDFELWPLAGSCSVLAWSYHTQPQMASLRISHLSCSLLFVFFYCFCYRPFAVPQSKRARPWCSVCEGEAGI